MKKFLFAFLALITVVASAQTYQQLISLASQAADNKDYQRACYLYEQALEKIPANNADTLALVYNALQLHYRHVDNYDKAIEYGWRMVELNRNFKGLPLSFLLLANTYAEAQQRDMAYTCLDSAKIYIEEYGIDSFRDHYFAIAGIISRHFNDFEKSADIHREAYQFAKDNKMVECIFSDGQLYVNALSQLKRYQEALQVLDELEQWAISYYGKESTEYRKFTYAKANITALSGDIDNGCRLYIQLSDTYRQKLREQLRVLPSEQRDALLQWHITVLQRMGGFGLAAKCNYDEFTKKAYESLLITKGILLAADRSVDDIIAQYGNDDDRAALELMKQKQQQLCVVEASDNSSVDAIASLYAEILQLDSEIAGRCSQYGDVSAFMNIDFETVRNSLGKNEVLLDFAEVNYTVSQRGLGYVCYEIRCDYQYPRIHEICFKSQIDSPL